MLEMPSQRVFSNVTGKISLGSSIEFLEKKSFCQYTSLKHHDEFLHCWYKKIDSRSLSDRFWGALEGKIVPFHWHNII
jgi:hypothetical protein